MRRRELSPSFFTSEQVSSCSIPSRLLFAGLWCLADREGRLTDDPWRIRLAVFPTDRVNVDALLDELVGHQLIVRYSTDTGDRLLAVPTFPKWQHVHPHEMKSALPAPVVTCNDMSGHVSGSQAGSSGTSGTSDSPVTPPSPSEGVAERVFEVWRVQRNHPSAKFIEQRRRAVRARLRDGYTEADLIAAVRGVALDPWPERVRHDDLTQILRDGEHVEKFRDMWQNPWASSGIIAGQHRTEAALRLLEEAEA